MTHFREFLESDTGQTFVAQVNGPVDLKGTLEENLAHLYATSADELSNETLKPTYDPMLEVLLKFVVNGAQIMKHYGIAKRDLDSPKQFSVKLVGTTDYVLEALETERAYHDTMFETGRETVQSKSPSDQALTVIGLYNNASKAVRNGESRLALKYLKDGVATGLRVLEEAQLPDSIAAKARAHYQEKVAVN